MDLRKLDFKDFKYNENVTDPMKSIFYDNVDNEDNWIQIASDSIEPDKTIVSIVIDCQTIWTSVFTEKDIDSLKDVVEKKAEQLLKG